MGRITADFFLDPLLSTSVRFWGCLCQRNLKQTEAHGVQVLLVWFQKASRELFLRGSLEVPVLSIGEILRSVGWDQVDLLKMDCEGLPRDMSMAVAPVGTVIFGCQRGM